MYARTFISGRHWPGARGSGTGYGAISAPPPRSGTSRSARPEDFQRCLPRSLRVATSAFGRASCSVYSIIGGGGSFGTPPPRRTAAQRRSFVRPTTSNRPSPQTATTEFEPPLPSLPGRYSAVDRSQTSGTTVPMIERNDLARNAVPAGASRGRVSARSFSAVPAPTPSGIAPIDRGAGDESQVEHGSSPEHPPSRVLDPIRVRSLLHPGPRCLQPSDDRPNRVASSQVVGPASSGIMARDGIGLCSEGRRWLCSKRCRRGGCRFPGRDRLVGLALFGTAPARLPPGSSGTIASIAIIVALFEAAPTRPAGRPRRRPATVTPDGSAAPTDSRPFRSFLSALYAR